MSKKNSLNKQNQPNIEEQEVVSSDYAVKNAKDLPFYHVRVENPKFDPKTGKRLSKPFIQMLTQAEYKQLMVLSENNGMIVELLHKPE